MNQEAITQLKGMLPKHREKPKNEPTPEELLAKARVTPMTELPALDNLFEIGGTPCFYRGELVASCGKAKSGKTLFQSIIMAGTLRRETLFLKRKEESWLKMLWIDTEQSSQTTQDIIVNRIIPLVCDEATEEEIRKLQEGFDEWFYAFNLRGLGFELRQQLLALTITTIHPDIVIIDGIKDLVTDINDAVQATLIMEQLMALAQTNNCCIVNVLHQNKSEADHNMRGSIGTELTNKAFEVFTCEYIEEGDVFKVSHTLSRKHRLKKKLYYQLSDEGLPEETVDYQEKPRDAKGRWVSSATAKTVANSEVKWEAFNQRYIHDHAWNIPLLFEDALENKSSRPYRQLMAATMRLGGIKDKNYFYTLLSEAEKTGVIQLVKHPENGETWVKLLSNQLPI